MISWRSHKQSCVSNKGLVVLLATNTDTGTVFVLDRRLTSSSYGKRFLQSIPTVPLYEGPLEELLVQLESSNE